jgi:hypothetical protein
MIVVLKNGLKLNLLVLLTWIVLSLLFVAWQAEHFSCASVNADGRDQEPGRPMLDVRSGVDNLKLTI